MVRRKVVEKDNEVFDFQVKVRRLIYLALPSASLKFSQSSNALVLLRGWLFGSAT